MALSLLVAANQPGVDESVKAQANVFAQVAIGMAGQVLEKQEETIYVPQVGGGTRDEGGSSVPIPLLNKAENPTVENDEMTKNEPKQVEKQSEQVDIHKIDRNWAYYITQSVYSLQYPDKNGEVKYEETKNYNVSFHVHQGKGLGLEITFNGQVQTSPYPKSMSFNNVPEGEYTYTIRVTGNEESVSSRGKHGTLQGKVKVFTPDSRR